MTFLPKFHHKSPVHICFLLLSFLFCKFFPNLLEFTVNIQIIAIINSFSQLANIDPTLETILNLDTQQREIYKKVATCQRLVTYRVNDADYTRIPIMLNLSDLTLNEAAIATIKLQDFAISQR